MLCLLRVLLNPVATTVVLPQPRRQRPSAERFVQRLEFRTPRGVGKSTVPEPAGRRRRSMGI